MTNRQDLPLKNDIAARFVPKIVTLLVYLGTLCFIFTLFMVHSTQGWERQLTTQLSVEIPLLPGEKSAPVQDKVLEFLNRTPGIGEVRVVSNKEIAALFQTLLQEEINLNQLSLPIILDISLNGKEKVDPETLERFLKNISSTIQVINHQTWQGQVSDLIHSGVLMASIITLLILCAVLTATTFATRTSLLIHRQVVEVLNLIGATNKYIALQFQLNALTQGIIASGLGSFFAFLTFLGIVTLLEKSGFSLSVSSSFFLESLFVFLLVPIVTAFSMMLSAKWAVMKALNS